jgi:hypothetical protein
VTVRAWPAFRPGGERTGHEKNTASAECRHLKAILTSLETWAGPGISADFPREQPWLRRQCRRAVIFTMFKWIYRCLKAAGAIEHLTAAAAYQFTE